MIDTRDLNSLVLDWIHLFLPVYIKRIGIYLSVRAFTAMQKWSPSNPDICQFNDSLQHGTGFRMKPGEMCSSLRNCCFCGKQAIRQ